MRTRNPQPEFVKEKPIRILQHLGGLNRGGIETWLMHILRGIDRSRFHIDFLVRSSVKGHYHEEVTDLGSEVLVCENHRNPLRFATEVGGMLGSRAPYDVVHSHLAQFDGVMMWVGSKHGIPTRISHSHNDTRSVYSESNFAWKAYCKTGRLLIDRYATHRLAASSEAAVSLFGENWRSDGKTQILRCGIDLTQFRDQSRDIAALRASLGIPEGARVVGHVGRFDPQKNHQLLIDIANSACSMDPSIHFVMVGDGPLKTKIESRVRQLALEDRVTFLSPRPDIPVLMKCVFDLFLLPSLHEGLPLVLLEAQAANLPCISSATVSAESEVTPGAIAFLPLSLAPEKWAKRVLTMLDARPRGQSDSNVIPISGTSFDSRVSTKRLCEIYSAHGCTNDSQLLGATA